MLIDSEPQGFGLVGRVFSWMLDLLPYCDSQGWQRADWRIYSPNYGEPPDFNIFPSVLEMVYTPDPKPAGMVSFDELHWRFNPQDGAGRHFNGDYQLANTYWTSYFKFTPDVTEPLDEWCKKNSLGAGTLGVHYRGTDQFTIHNESTPVTIGEFLLVLDDFLQATPGVRQVFAASDDANFIAQLHSFCFEHQLPSLCHLHIRSVDGCETYTHHPWSQNRLYAHEALRDCLTLAKCEWLLANYSSLSAWAKVVNPHLKSYRMSACTIYGTERGGAFPHGWAPLYEGHSAESRALLGRLQAAEWTKHL